MTKNTSSHKQWSDLGGHLNSTCVAYDEVLAHEQSPTVIGFLSRATAWFDSKGIEYRRVMSDNGPACESKEFTKA